MCVFRPLPPPLLPVTNCEPSSRFISLRADWICDARRRRRLCLKEANSKTPRYDNACRGYCRVDGRAACDAQTYGRIPHVCSATPATSREPPPPPLARHLSCLRGLSVVILNHLKLFPKSVALYARLCFRLPSQIYKPRRGTEAVDGRPEIG